MTFAQITDAPRPTPAPPNTAGPALPWPPTGRQSADKPAGGFFQCPTDFLTLPWGLYRDGHLPFLALRTWYGLLELPERRVTCPPDQDVHYRIEELCQLLQAPRRAPVQAALRTLEDVGLVAWSESDIRYLPEPAALQARALPGYQALQAQLPPWRTWVPAPRRLVRWLARDSTPGLCATAAGVLLRCLWSKGRRCVSGGRVAARWIATGFGVAERTVHRALDGLQEVGWLARLPSTSAADVAAERRWGARTVVNLAWNTPGAPEPEGGAAAPGPDTVQRAPARPQRQEVFVEHAVKHSVTRTQNLAPLPGKCDQNLSPLPPVSVPISPGKSRTSTPSFGTDFYPFQEETPDPVPALLARAHEEEENPGMSLNAHDEDHEARALPTVPAMVHSTPIPAELCADTLAEIPIAMPVEMPPTMPADTPMAVFLSTCADVPSAVPAAAPVPAPAARAPLADPAALFAALPAAEQEEHLCAATARLLARGFAAECILHSALLANVYTHLASSGAAPGPTSPASAVPAPPGPGPAAPLRPVPTPVASVPPAPTPGSPRGSAPGVPVRSGEASAEDVSPSLRHVVPADLHDHVRLEALRQQAIRRGWLTGSAADRLSFVTAAVHARRVGSDPCALFVALVREQRWELLTDGDEDQARALLTGPPPASAPPRVAATPAPALSADARLVRLVLSILRQDGWSGDPFAAMQQHHPDWTRARWDAALAEALGRRVRGGMERLGRGLEGEE